MQSVRLTGGFAQVPRRDFIYCSGWEDRTPFAGLRTRLQADPEWQVHDLPTAHNAMHEDPEAVAALLLGERIDRVDGPDKPGEVSMSHGTRIDWS